jgi:hypothetical protein
MVFSFVLLFIKLLLHPISSVKKDLLLLVFTVKKENEILHRSFDLKKKRPKIKSRDRVMYSILYQVSEKVRDHFTLIKPETVLKWVRQLTRRFWTYPAKKEGGDREHLLRLNGSFWSLRIRIFSGATEGFKGNCSNWVFPWIKGPLLKS